MGLGKTLEILALILAHQNENYTSQEVKKFEKMERIACICGQELDDNKWVQCDSWYFSNFFHLIVRLVMVGLINHALDFVRAWKLSK